MNLNSTLNRSTAVSYFYGTASMPAGWNLHHKDPAWRYSDHNRYNQFNLCDLIPLTDKEHGYIHSLLNRIDKPEFERELIIFLRKVLNRKSEFFNKERNQFEDVPVYTGSIILPVIKPKKHRFKANSSSYKMRDKEVQEAFR